MTIDFSGFNAPEGFPVEVLKTPELIQFCKDSVDRQVNAHVSTIEDKLNKTTTAKAIADQKVSDLQLKLEEAGRAGSGDQEIDKLKSQLEKARQDAASEYTAQIDAIKAENEKLQGANDELNQTLVRNDLTSYIRDGIAQYNSKHEGVKAIEGSEKYLIEAALKHWQKTPEGEYRAFDGDKPLTSPSGFMTCPEYIAGLRDNPETKIFFNQPTGGGASGANGGGAGDKTLTRSQFAAMNPADQAKVVQTHTITDG